MEPRGLKYAAGFHRPEIIFADVAQLVEQLTRNEQVVRSSRIVGSIYVFGLIRDLARRLCRVPG